jgi:hypothetical protein
MALGNVIDRVCEAMDVDHLRPAGFAIECTAIDDEMSHSDMAPLTLGNAITSNHYAGLLIHVAATDGRACTLPVHCQERQYTAPVGLGSTMVANSMVLMYPLINQYLVPQQMREP